MLAQVITTELSLPWFTVNALAFLPTKEARSEWAIFTHGYTSHKGDCLNWATRMSEAGVPCIIFDQPGHYLGSFHEAESLEDFKNHLHELFSAAYERLQLLMEQRLGVGNFPACQSVILGGHSLGAYSCIRALELDAFKNMNRIAIGIGIGISQHQSTHLFETSFYEKTLSIRRQLVSPALDTREVFAWLKKEKETMTVSQQRIHLITGEDDLVVGRGGMQAFISVLEENGNVVTSEEPKKLPHHEPGSAAPHLYAFLKNHFGWK